MTAKVEALPWDSDFFGIPIGRMVLEGVDPVEVAAAESDARDQGLACLYLTLDPADATAAYQVQALGYGLVEVANLFELRQDEPPIPRPDGMIFRVAGPDDVDGVAEIVDLMAPWSRFAVDPRFGLEASRRMQRAWLDRAVGPSEGHSLMVAEEEGEIIAFIGRVHAERARVDAVGTTRRGSGAARALIEDARAWAGDQPLLGGPIAGRNIPSLRYVSRCNYRILQVEYIYHRWLDV